MKQGRHPTQTNLFNATLNETLKHYTDPAWLGNNIPLATPYFLGRHLHHVRNPNTPPGLGRALQAVIAEAADSLWPGPLPQSQQGLLSAVARERTESGSDGSRYRYLLLDLRYLRRYFPPSAAPNQVSAMPDYLGVSKTRFFEHLKEARDALGAALLKLVQPGLRLEQPIPSGPIIGRTELLQQCLHDLRNGRSVTLSGIGGAGKTTLGSAIAQQWQSDTDSTAVYWYTFRPGLNDDLDSLVFTLAHFLSQQGCPNLWLQLNANDGRIGRIEQALGFLREDFQCAAQKPVLICFDEVDLLHTTGQPHRDAHHQLLEFLQSLKPLAPLLLIGQRTLIDTAVHYVLPSLTLPQTATLLREANVSPSITAEQLHGLTEGNPRLIELYLALYKSSSDGDELNLPKSAAVEPIFSRLWKRLNPDEKEILTTLSTFRSFAPANEWQDEQGFHLLRERRLLKFDATGGVALLPLFRQLVYDALPPQRCREAHQQAAAVRSQHGRYTEAAYHLWLAEQHDLAVNLWSEYQDIEIRQGKTAAAHAFFCRDETIQLVGRSAKKLTLIRNRLNLLFGEAQQVLARMDGFNWQPGERETADALQQWGEAHFIVGDTKAALGRYDDAIRVLSEVSSQLLFLHQKRGQMFIGQAATSAARREIQQAEYELETFKGLVEIAKGQFLQAQSHFDSAFELAQILGDEQRCAKSNQHLAMAFGNYGDISQAHRYAGEAMRYFDRVGDRLQLEGLRAEMAGFYLNAGRFAEVIEPAEQALRFFENIQHQQRIGYLCSNLAEAYFETGAIETAESYANRALQSGNPRVQPYVCYTLGLIHQAKKNLSQAAHYFQRGIDNAEQAEERFIAAYLYRAYGRMLLENGNNDQGTNKLNQALALFTDLTMQHEVAKTQELFL